MATHNPLNFPGVKAVPLCWKCERAMVRDEANKQWKCPADGTVTTDAEIAKQAQ